MTSVEDGEAGASEEVPVGNPDEIAKNPAALKGKQIFHTKWSWLVVNTRSLYILVNHCH